MYSPEPVQVVAAYGILVRTGVLAFMLRGNYDKLNDPWTMEFENFGPLTLEQCKEPVIKYLKTAYQADKITFLKRSSHKESQFYVQFNRGDVKR